MSEVCPNVCTEPELQPLSGEVLHGRSAYCQDGARVDIMGGFWERLVCTLMCSAISFGVGFIANKKRLPLSTKCIIVGCMGHALNSSTTAYDMHIGCTNMVLTVHKVIEVHIMLS